MVAKSLRRFEEIVSTYSIAVNYDYYFPGGI